MLQTTSGNPSSICFALQLVCNDSTMLEACPKADESTVGQWITETMKPIGGNGLFGWRDVRSLGPTGSDMGPNGDSWPQLALQKACRAGLGCSFWCDAFFINYYVLFVILPSAGVCAAGSWVSWFHDAHPYWIFQSLWLVIRKDINKAEKDQLQRRSAEAWYWQLIYIEIYILKYI